MIVIVASEPNKLDSVEKPEPFIRDHSQLTCITQQSLKSGHYFFGDVVYGGVAAGLP